MVEPVWVGILVVLSGILGNLFERISKWVFEAKKANQTDFQIITEAYRVQGKEREDRIVILEAKTVAMQLLIAKVEAQHASCVAENESIKSQMIAQIERIDELEKRLDEKRL